MYVITQTIQQVAATQPDWQTASRVAVVKQNVLNPVDVVSQQTALFTVC